MSLSLGIYIKKALNADSDIRALVGSRIYPIAAPEGTSNPFIVYSHPNVVGNSTKDGRSYDASSIDVSIVSKDYDEAVAIAEKVRNSVESMDVNGDTVLYCDDLSGSSGNLDGDYYVIALSFSFTTEY